MKIRSDFVTNSSSSSFVIFDDAQEYSKYRHPLTKETIKKLIDDVLMVYRNFEETICKEDSERIFLEALPERFRDYQIFKKGQIEEITKAFEGEFWSASGVYIPDEIHDVLKRTEYDAPYKRPTKKEVKEACKKLENFCKEKNISMGNIFNKNALTQYFTECNSGEWYFSPYYDYEFQEALRGDFCIITGENAFPYGVITFLENVLPDTKYYHLG